MDIITWPLMEAEFQEVYSHTGRITTTKNGVSVFSDDASAFKSAFCISSGSYYGLTMHELV